MLSEQDLIDRIVTIKNLNNNCFKYLEESSKGLLTQQIIYAVARLVTKKMEPVRLSEIAQSIFNTTNKAQQDNIRLTIEKTLLKCGIIEKLRYSVRDVRYILTAYRFQKTQNIDSFRGDRLDNIGQVFELPKNLWPIPDEYFLLKTTKNSLEYTLKKINSDFDSGSIPKGKYENMVLDLNDKLEKISTTIRTKYDKLDLLVIK
ncbi:hypothetical protein [Candidatus Nitrosotenuis sp. DW1]|uniref:hypothetical protein n=1 Tax=Candidatus Nitrosotenuis sp. DW1 TaxID=2259672 RepID=UPI0015CE2D03|nr:hypothetical protein [Candidatus Nitrosotenuis sp. DW1]QLH08908.1 hypothetical protein DSQ19_04900 [Candidatus Nitrosotenuis sp. DW1]